jgi:hypothetical protein
MIDGPYFWVIGSIEWLRTPPERRRGLPEPGVRRVVRIVEDLKRATG